MINYGKRLIVNQENYADAKLDGSHLSDDLLLEDGEALLKIDKFAYTANNVTYALVGHRIGYWKFFPVEEKGYGIIPCWGFADVVESKCPEVATGTRFYGFLPMATHLKIKPGKVSHNSIIDDSEHRRGLPVIYNQLINCSNDPLYQRENEELQSLIRPLFTTSFLIHDQYVQNDFYHSDQIILVSASSKTGLSLASCMKNENKKIIGLTSARNMNMVKSSGYYDEVFSYDDIAQIKKLKSSIVDFAGNHSIQLKLQKHLGDQVQMITMVGMVRWEDNKDMEPLAIKPEFFFAPTYAERRIKELGPKEFGMRLSSKYLNFVNEAKKWISIKHFKLENDLLQLHRDMLSGSFEASAGNIVTT